MDTYELVHGRKTKPGGSPPVGTSEGMIASVNPLVHTATFIIPSYSEELVFGPAPYSPAVLDPQPGDRCLIQFSSAGIEASWIVSWDTSATGSHPNPYVTLAGAQTITGPKTFTTAPTFNTPLPIASGGTGSIIQNFVDLTTSQTIGGIKSYTSPFRQADGSAAAPSYSFTNTTSEGMYRPSAGVLGFSVPAAGSFSFRNASGTEMAKITDTGVISGLSISLTGLIGSPRVYMKATDAGADGKTWDILPVNNELRGRMLNDAETTTTTWMSVFRTGVSTPVPTFYGTLTAGTIGTSFGGVDVKGAMDGYHGQLRFSNDQGSGTIHGITTLVTGNSTMYFDHRGTGNLSGFNWRNGTNAGTTLMSLDGTGVLNMWSGGSVKVSLDPGNSRISTRGDQSGLIGYNSGGTQEYLFGLRSDVTGNTADVVTYTYGGAVRTYAGGTEQIRADTSGYPWMRSPGMNAFAGTYLNGWSDYPSWGPGRYTKDAQGFVHLTGLITAGAVGTITTLPVGYRPTQNVMANVHCANAGYARLDIYQDGSIVLIEYGGGGGNGYLQLDGIVFPTF